MSLMEKEIKLEFPRLLAGRKYTVTYPAFAPSMVRHRLLHFAVILLLIACVSQKRRAASAAR